MIDGMIEQLIQGVQRNTDSQEMYIAALEILVGSFLTLGATLIGIGSGFAVAMSDSIGEQFTRNWMISAAYYIVGTIILVFGARLFGKAFIRKKKNRVASPHPTKVRILVDEMLDGTDEKLRDRSYEAYSIKKLREKGEKLRSDYSILKYVEINNMVLITEDDENVDACKENDIMVIKHGQNRTFENLVSELEKLVKIYQLS